MCFILSLSFSRWKGYSFVYNTYELLAVFYILGLLGYRGNSVYGKYLKFILKLGNSLDI